MTAQEMADAFDRAAEQHAALQEDCRKAGETLEIIMRHSKEQSANVGRLAEILQRFIEHGTAPDEADWWKTGDDGESVP